MNLSFLTSHADRYSGASQKIRKITEHWVGEALYCPNCGAASIKQYENNRPVADFVCACCKEEYELKSHGRNFGAKLVDGAYRTMIDRLQASTNPNLLLLQYDPHYLLVRNFLVVPKFFFVPELIAARKPLSILARRAGWVGCTISLDKIPRAGRIFLVKDGIVTPKYEVMSQWRMTCCLGAQKDLPARSWLLGIIRCIESIDKNIFTLNDIYQYEVELGKQFPSNRHIKAKIRQKLQILRDTGYLIFVGKGTYRIAGPGRDTGSRDPSTHGMVC